MQWKDPYRPSYDKENLAIKRKRNGARVKFQRGLQTASHYTITWELLHSCGKGMSYYR